MRRFVIGLMTSAILFGAYLWITTYRPQSLLAAAGGSITGRVVLVGEVPKAKKIEITKDKEKCGTERAADDLVISSDRGIKNAVVSLLEVKGSPAKLEKSPVLDQTGCAFNPRVLIVPVGTSVDILNNDGILHNIHTYSNKNPAINKAQPGFKKKMSETFTQPEIIKINCDAHSWMVSWFVVTDHPYVAVTETGGSFKIADVPPGTYKIEVWHETLGKATKEVSVKVGEEAKVTFELATK